MRQTMLKAMLAVLLLPIVSLYINAEDQKPPGNWVSAWSTAVQAPLAFPGLPPAPIFENQTVRMVIRPTLRGQQVRVRFSNAFGSTPLEIGSAHIALAGRDAAIVPETDRTITFGGRPSVTVPVGAPILSDPVATSVRALEEFSISVYLPRKTPGSTTHFWAQRTTYVSGVGDFSARTDIPNATVSSSWYFLSDIEVLNPDNSAAVVTLGDSITDGVGAKQGIYADWPDQLAKRLGDSGISRLAILNEGIGGNRILHDGAGISALARLDRDVLAQPGVGALILLEGINDIGWPHMKPIVMKDGTSRPFSPFATEGVTADDIIEGMRQIVDRAHEHHIRVFGATLTPYEGADYFSKDGEQVRQTVNQWIRASGVFDGVFDFDAAVRDPSHPAQFRDGYHSGDHLHPSPAGYAAMAQTIDLALLQGSIR